MIDRFADLESYYPGSRERRQTVASPRPPVVDEDLLGPGKPLNMGGTMVEFYTIGQVARAINRTAGTLRKWEAQGILPKPYAKSRNRDGRMITDPRGQRRLYSKPQALGIIRTVIELDLMDPRSGKPLGGLAQRLEALFEELRRHSE